MPSLRDIKRRIKSVQNTAQITKAMKMIAAAKLKKAENKVISSRPYSQRLTFILQNLLQASDLLSHPFLEKREVRSRCLVVITSDRGLCGSFNSNMIRNTLEALSQNPSIKKELYLIGKKGKDFFTKQSWTVVKSFQNIGGDPDITLVRQMTQELIHRFLNSEVDEIRLLFTSFLSTSSYRITSKKFLNLELITGNEKHGNLDYIFEPDPESILSDLLPRFLVNILYTAITESFASEQVARMIAMSAASKNAEDLIKTLTLQYNKTRQANITKEISEIVTGAEALK